MKSQSFRSSAVHYDGSALQLHNSGEVTLTTAATNSKECLMVPWNANIDMIYVNVRTAAAASTTGATIGIGNKTSATAYGSISPLFSATGNQQFRGDTLTNNVVAAGDTVVIVWPQVTVLAVCNATVVTNPNTVSA